MRLAAVICLSLLFTGAARAAGGDDTVYPGKLSETLVSTALAGEWRAHRTGAGNACGAQAGETDLSMTLEFAMTGGRATFNDGSEDSGAAGIKTISGLHDDLTLHLADGGTWTFHSAGIGHMVSTVPPQVWASAAQRDFYRCQKAADRGAIHLSKAQIAAISGAMPNGPVLIDTRAPKGCNALEYQYLNFDLVGPTGFVLHRWNSVALGEKLADRGKPAVKTDEIADFRIEKADAIAGGYRFTVTELIPPNGARGDTTTITVNVKGNSATIPEWKRNYALCTAPK